MRFLKQLSVLSLGLSSLLAFGQAYDEPLGFDTNPYNPLNWRITIEDRTYSGESIFYTRDLLGNPITERSEYPRRRSLVARHTSRNDIANAKGKATGFERFKIEWIGLGPGPYSTLARDYHKLLATMRKASSDVNDGHKCWQKISGAVQSIGLVERRRLAMALLLTSYSGNDKTEIDFKNPRFSSDERMSMLALFIDEPMPEEADRLLYLSYIFVIGADGYYRKEAPK
jgi:hypothetical protein